MSQRPTHFKDVYNMKTKEKTGVIYFSSNDIIRIIEKIASTDARETHVKCEEFEITVKK